MSSRFTWYLARSSGITAWVLVTFALVWGLLLATRVSRRARPAWVLDLHRFLGGLSVTFVGVHLGALAADSFTHWGLSDLLLPMATSWKPGPVAWGVVGLYLLVAIELTSLLMRHLPRKTWRAVHLTSYALFIVATVHGLAAGTDAASPWVEWGALLGVLVVAYLTVIRVIAGRLATSDATGSGSPRRLEPVEDGGEVIGQRRLVPAIVSGDGMAEAEHRGV